MAKYVLKNFMALTLLMSLVGDVSFCQPRGKRNAGAAAAAADDSAGVTPKRRRAKAAAAPSRKHVSDGSDAETTPPKRLKAQSDQSDSTSMSSAQESALNLNALAIQLNLPPKTTCLLDLPTDVLALIHAYVPSMRFSLGMTSKYMADVFFYSTTMPWHPYTYEGMPSRLTARVYKMLNNVKETFEKGFPGFDVEESLMQTVIPVIRTELKLCRKHAKADKKQAEEDRTQAAILMSQPEEDSIQAKLKQQNIRSLDARIAELTDLISQTYRQRADLPVHSFQLPSYLKTRGALGADIYLKEFLVSFRQDRADLAVACAVYASQRNPSYLAHWQRNMSLFCYPRVPEIKENISLMHQLSFSLATMTLVRSFYELESESKYMSGQDNKKGAISYIIACLKWMDQKDFLAEAAPTSVSNSQAWKFFNVLLPELLCNSTVTGDDRTLITKLKALSELSVEDRTALLEQQAKIEGNERAQGLLGERYLRAVAFSLRYAKSGLLKGVAAEREAPYCSSVYQISSARRTKNCTIMDRASCNRRGCD